MRGEYAMGGFIVRDLHGNKVAAANDRCGKVGTNALSKKIKP